MLGVGIWLAATQGSFATLSSSFPSLSAANLLIITGAFVMAIGFVGCLGAIKENKCLLLAVSARAQACSGWDHAGWGSGGPQALGAAVTPRRGPHLWGLTSRLGVWPLLGLPGCTGAGVTREHAVACREPSLTGHWPW